MYKSRNDHFEKKKYFILYYNTFIDTNIKLNGMTSVLRFIFTAHTYIIYIYIRNIMLLQYLS